MQGRPYRPTRQPRLCSPFLNKPEGNNAEGTPPPAKSIPARSHVPSPRFRMVGLVVPPSTFRQLTLNKRKLSYPPHQFLVILSRPSRFTGQPPSSPAGNRSYALVDCCLCPFGWVGGVEGEIRPSTKGQIVDVHRDVGGVRCFAFVVATPAMI